MLAALFDAPIAWQSPEELAEALGWPPCRAQDALCDLNILGLIDVWADHPDGLVVTLSALSAERLGVTLVETAGAEVYRWSSESASVRSRRPRLRPSARAVERSDAHQAALEQVPDRGAPDARDLDEEIDRAERLEARFTSRVPIPRREFPRPTHLISGPPAALIAGWDETPRGPRPPLDCRQCRPGPKRRRLRKLPPACRCGRGLRRPPKWRECPACQGRPLSTLAYCLRCGRWGLTEAIAARGGRRERPSTPNPEPPMSPPPRREVS